MMPEVCFKITLKRQLYFIRSLAVVAHTIVITKGSECPVLQPLTYHMKIIPQKMLYILSR
jgi:hypothetical protein